MSRLQYKNYNKFWFRPPKWHLLFSNWSVSNSLKISPPLWSLLYTQKKMTGHAIKCQMHVVEVCKKENDWPTGPIHTQKFPSWNKVTFLPLKQCPQLQTPVLQRELQVCWALVLGSMSGLPGVLVHNSHKCLTTDLVLNRNSSAVRQAAWGYCQMKG